MLQLDRNGSHHIPPMPHELLTLGPPDLRIDGPDEAELRRGKRLALLIYLALEVDGESRDELADLFWPDSEPSRARHSVRQALFVLRKTLGADVFASEDPVRLEPGALRVDVQELEALLSEGDVDAALELWRGPFLEGFAVPGLPRWQRWVEERRSGLERRLGRAVAAEATRCVETGELDRAIHYLRRAVRIQVYSGDHHARLISVLLDRGLLDEAEEALLAARTALRPLDGEAVLDPVEARLDSLKREAAAAAARQPANRYGLAGRSDALASLLGAWRTARQGAVERVLVRGSSGLGKSRLVEELSRAAAAQGGRVVELRGARGEMGLRMGGVTGLARQLLQEPGAAGISAASDRVLRSLLPSMTGSGTPGTEAAPDADAIQVTDGLLDLLAAVAHEGPLLLVIDDFHWLDPWSARVIVRAVRHLRRGPVAVVMVAPDPASILDTHVHESIRGLADEFTVVDLEPLDAESIEAFAREELAFADEHVGDVAGALHRISGGRPRYLVQILDFLREYDALPDPEDEPDAPAGRTALTLLETLTRTELARSRLEDASPTARQLTLEVARRRAGTREDRVRRNLGLTPQEFRAALREAVEVGLVTRETGGRLVLQDSAVREAAASFSGLPLSRRISNRPLLSAAIATAAVLLAWLGIPLLPGSNPVEADAVTRPYGGGTVVFSQGDSVFTMSRTQEGGWHAAPADFWYPRHPWAVGPFPTTAGDTIWFTRIREPDQAPFIVRVRPDGPPDTVFRTPGDDWIGDVSPDGSGVLYRTGNQETPEYDLDLYVASVDGSRRRLLARSSARIGDARWSRDGRHIALVKVGRTDSLLVTTPLGDRILALELQARIHALDWCSSDRVALIAFTGPDGRIEMVDLDGNRDQKIVPGLSAQFLACSPNGRGVLHQGVVDRQIRTVLLDWTTGASEVLPPMGRVPSARVRWLPPEVEPVIASVDVRASSLVLPWGGVRAVEATIRDTEGSVMGESPAWTSRDPSVASVQGGRISANRVGSTWVVATAGGWRRDSVAIHVVGEFPEEVSFHDEFETLSPDLWVIDAVPQPRATVFQGEPVLELRGDGRYQDQIITREGFVLPGGATLEFEFRLRPHRSSHQELSGCLAQEAPETPPGADLAQRPWGAITCFAYPADELARFDPEVIAFSRGWGPATEHHVPQHLPTDGWTHVALQVRTDGQKSLFLDRQLVAVTDRWIEHDPALPWHIQIAGAAEGTRVFIRNLTLSHGLRHVPPSSPATEASGS